MAPENVKNGSRTCKKIDLKITFFDLKNRPRKMSGAIRVIRVIIMVPGMHWETCSQHALVETNVLATCVGGIMKPLERPCQPPKTTSPEQAKTWQANVLATCTGTKPQAAGAAEQ